MKIESLTDNPQFVETVAGWIYKEFIENIRHGVKYENILDRLGKMTRNEVPCTLVAVENGICLGTVSLFENDLKERGDLTPWLASLYVSEEFRGRGIAKELINELCSITRGLGYDSIYLRTEHTAEYYKKLGWKSIYTTVDEFNLTTEVFAKQL